MRAGILLFLGINLESDIAFAVRRKLQSQGFQSAALWSIIE